MHEYGIMLAQGEAPSAPAAPPGGSEAQTQTGTKADGSPTPQDQAPQREAPWWWTFLPLILMFVIFYFFLFRGRSKEEKKRKEMLANLGKGMKIMTIGGVKGTVVDVREDEVVVKVDENANVKMRFTRGAIQKVVE